MRIMVCFDGSNASIAAVDLAGKFAKAFAAKLFIVTSMVGGAEDTAKEIKRLEENLNQLKRRFENNGIPCEVHLLIRGLSAGEDIVLFAGENDIDQILIGIEKKSKVGKLLFGSTAQYVILEASCPVVAVK
ncbi:MAG: universal stress protein [Thermodesulfobacteriota bacterium]